ncbi:MAG: UDP-N-acetylmuramoyl-tripeptide--D-alanyl-D-alanine ligase [Ruminococcaceae bacterium]|nr:UDP-N-acetylmuramoyl-tripeptide--D-alanyl-D-alanine ligase [Oscillospiraceae bacterium]
MEILWTILYIVCFLASLASSSIYFYHMFQQNSYKPHVQLSWYGKNALKLLPSAVMAIISMVIAIFVTADFALAIAAIPLLIGILFTRPRKAKVAFVYTPRIKRMLACEAILALGVAVGFIFASKLVLAAAVSFLYAFCPLFILAVNMINRPLELAINRYYINDAKRIINESPNLTVIGITGSYGKTSVKYFLARLLAAKYETVMTPENYNTTLGVVRTIRQSIRATTEMFVCEMGARNVGDIKEICELVKPKHGVITAIGQQHMESFKTQDNIIRTKMELADSVADRGMLFFNNENEFLKNSPVKHISYGISADCDFSAFGESVSQNGTEFFVRTPNGESQRFSTKLIGRHNIVNLVGAIAVANSLGVPLESLTGAVRRLEAVPHRLQLVRSGKNIIIDDAYNSNPAGARAALDALSMFDGTRVLVTPGMVELGDMQDELNREFGKYASQKCDYAVLVGEKQTKAIYKGLCDGGFDVKKIIVAQSLNDAMARVQALPTDSYKAVLLENDLPDNFN